MYEDNQKISNSTLYYYLLLIYLRYTAEYLSCLLCEHLKIRVWEW